MRELNSHGERLQESRINLESDSDKETVEERQTPRKTGGGA